MSYRLRKRIFDLVISISLLFFLWPILLIVSIVVRVFIGSPIIFTQMRPGLHEKVFYLYKFRTMTNKKDLSGKLLPDANRLTPLGKFLRSFSLDELPTLINVIKGEMSLVGPRPLLVDYLPFYTATQRVRHHVKPGITGWAQINGRNLLSWEEKFNLDVWYVENVSFALDIKIILLTFIKVIKRDGISAKGQATMSRFDMK